VVIPDVDLGNGSVCRGEGLSAVPSYVIVIVILVTLGSHLVVEGEMSPLMRVADVDPWLERTIDLDPVVVDLVTTTYHDVERPLFVNAQDIIP